MNGLDRIIVLNILNYELKFTNYEALDSELQIMNHKGLYYEFQSAKTLLFVISNS